MQHKAHTVYKVHHIIIQLIPEIHGEPTTAAVHKKASSTSDSSCRMKVLVRELKVLAGWSPNSLRLGT